MLAGKGSLLGAMIGGLLRLQIRSVHAVDDLGPVLLVHVAVAVESDMDTRMAKLRHPGLGVRRDRRIDQEAGVGVCLRS